MAIAKKGSRKISVDGQLYYWKFNEKIYVGFGKDRQGLLIIDFGWFDEWLYMNDPTNRPLDFFPKKVTPEFVKQGILFANKMGWNPEKDSRPFKLNYRELEFMLA